ncbi:MAG: hypothetical protein IJ489_05640 [Clostridia bacterium]|nr:hypothetical protein [Clostridia bacterium]
MWNKFKYSFMYGMGVMGLTNLFLSLVFDGYSIREMQMSFCLGIAVEIFAFFTFELKLFSKHLWVRRGIVMFVGFCFAVGSLFAFGTLNSENWTKKLLFLVIPMFALAFLGLIFFYYVSDKIEKHNLEIINKKLENNQNTEDHS